MIASSTYRRSLKDLWLREGILCGECLSLGKLVLRHPSLTLLVSLQENYSAVLKRVAPFKARWFRWTQERCHSIWDHTGCVDSTLEPMTRSWARKRSDCTYNEFSIHLRHACSSLLCVLVFQVCWFNNDCVYIHVYFILVYFKRKADFF